MRDPLYKDEFELYLQEQAGKHRMYPSDHVWRSIQDTLHEKGRWPALTFIFLFIISLLVVGTLLVKPEDHLHYIHKTPYLIAGDAGKAITIDSLVPSLSESLATGKATEKTIAYVHERLVHTIDDSIISAAPATITAAPVSLMAPATLTAAIALSALPAETERTSLPELNTDIVTGSLSLEETTLAATIQPAVIPVTSVAVPEPAVVAASSDVEEAPLPEITVVSKTPSRWDFQLYVTPSASFRRLVEEKTTKGMAQYLSSPMAPNYLVDVNRVVRHTPAPGFEIGFALGYRLNQQFSIRTGLQYNMRQYSIEASGYSYEITSINLNGQDPVNTYTRYRNIKGDYPVTLHNRYHEFSIPVGLTWTGWRHNKLSWGVSTTLQPTYTFNKQPFIISSDFKNYANGASFTRRWNINTSFETYLSYTIGDVQWQIGPQFRYQQLSSFRSEYPIKEFLLDYGFKIGFRTPL